MNFASASLKGPMERGLHLTTFMRWFLSEWFLERRGLNNEVPFLFALSNQLIPSK